MPHALAVLQKVSDTFMLKTFCLYRSEASTASSDQLSGSPISHKSNSKPSGLNVNEFTSCTTNSSSGTTGESDSTDRQSKGPSSQTEVEQQVLCAFSSQSCS